MTTSRRITSAALTIIALLVVIGAGVWAWRAQKAAELQTFRTHMLRELIATTDRGFIVLNPYNQIVEWGPGAERIFGWQSAEVLGSTPDFLMPVEMQPIHRAALAKSAGDAAAGRLHKPISVSCWAFKKDGTLVNVKMDVRAFKNHIGYYHAALLTAVDADDPIPAVVIPRPADPGKPSLPLPGPIPEIPAGIHYEGK